MSEPSKTHQDCPYCGHKGCLTVWPDGGFSCHSCNATPKTHGVSTPSKSEPTYKEEVRAYRGISKKAVDKYKVRTQLTDKGEEYARIYPYPHKEKKRILPKNFTDNRGFSNDHLFGMDKFNAGSSKFLVIVEGEDHVPTAYDMLGCTHPVVGIPGASINSELLKNCHKYIDAFDGIVAATDNDDAGDKAAARLADAFPNKVYRMSLTLHNDPQDYLQAGDRDAFKWAFHNKQKYVPEFDTNTSDQYLTILREDTDDEYISSGIHAYDEKHMGLFQGNVTLFQAPEGTGKTELFHFFEYHMLTNYPDIPFASCHLEESKKRTTLAWASYDLEKNVTRQDLISDQKEVDDAVVRLTKSDNAHLFKIGLDEDPTVLLDRIKYYATVCGCKYIFIEPIQDLAQQGHNEQSDERFLSKIAVGLSRIATDLGVGILIIAHENDDGLVSDCRKLSKQASVVVRLERTIDAVDEEVRNTTTLWSKKNRPSSFVGYGGELIFDPSTFVLKEK